MYTTRKNYGFAPRNIGGFIEDALQNGWHRFNEEVSAYSVPVNIQETDKNYELHVVAPGLKKDDIKVNVDKNILTISYEHAEESKETEPKWLRSEYKQRSFKRSFTLNDKIDTTQISAKYTDGVLFLSLPKKEVTEPTAQSINVE